MRGALIHLARVVSSSAALTPNAQGELEMTVSVGPWIPARVTERGGPAAKARRSAQTDAARVERGYEVLLSPLDADGVPVAVPPASCRIETLCEVLDDPTIVVTTRAEVLNNGRKLIGYALYGNVVEDAA